MVFYKNPRDSKGKTYFSKKIKYFSKKPLKEILLNMYIKIKIILRNCLLGQRFLKENNFKLIYVSNFFLGNS